MFAMISRSLYEKIQEEPSAYYHHRQCMMMDKFQTTGLLNDFNVLATNFDLDGVEYASLIEHKRYPFYGSQFHPEKFGFEWNPMISIERPESGNPFAQSLLNFFMREVEKNKHFFVDPGVLYKIEIDNYPSIHTMLLDETLLQVHYYFDLDSYDRPLIDFRLGIQKYAIIKRYLDATLTIKF